MIQKGFTKERGCPVPSKYAYPYENLLGHCPYEAFFDTDTLCHKDNATNVSKLGELQGEKATDFFNVTFRGAAKTNQAIKL